MLAQLAAGKQGKYLPTHFHLPLFWKQSHFSHSLRATQQRMTCTQNYCSSSKFVKEIQENHWEFWVWAEREASTETGCICHRVLTPVMNWSGPPFQTVPSSSFKFVWIFAALYICTSLLTAHTAPQRCQPGRSVTLDFLLVSCYCDLDMTISVAK